MLRDFSMFLWPLKLGALPNLYFLASSFTAPASAVDPQLLVPARILFAVSAFRCSFPNQYKGNVVFHDAPLSSIFLTRLLATFAEIGFIYLLARVLRRLNVDRDARRKGESLHPAPRFSRAELESGLRRSLRERHRTTDATARGGLVVLALRLAMRSERCQFPSTLRPKEPS